MIFRYNSVPVPVILLLFLFVFNHQLVSKIVVAEAMHVRDALADKLVGLGFVEECECVLQRQTC